MSALTILCFVPPAIGLAVALWEAWDLHKFRSVINNINIYRRKR